MLHNEAADACLQVRPVAGAGRLLAWTAIGRARGESTPDASARCAGSPAAALARPTQQRESPHTHQRTTRLHRLYRLTPLNAAFASGKSLRHWAAAGWQALPPTGTAADTAKSGKRDRAHIQTATGWRRSHGGQATGVRVPLRAGLGESAGGACRGRGPGGREPLSARTGPRGHRLGGSRHAAG